LGKLIKVAAALLGAVVLLGTLPAYMLYGVIRKAAREDPRVWTEDVAELVRKTRQRKDLDEAVLFIGSSSIRLWSTLDRDMAPLVTIRHGFGGAKLNDVAYYAEQLVNAFSPRAVVVFAGSNDLSPGDTKPPRRLLDSYRQFVSKIRVDLPKAGIYFIGITPTVLRWEVWDEIQETNRLIREFSGQHVGLHYIETGPLLLGQDGQPDGDNYRIDGLHLSDRGYAIWTKVIRSRLMKDLHVNASR
jgi:hypothetical protein